MDNLDSVLKSLEILTSDWGYNFSPKKITVSTIGLKKGILRFLKESECHLALSLHSPFPEERAGLMPIETVFPAEDILAELRQEDWSRNRRFSIEYIVFGGLNHSPAHAKALARLLQGLKIRINLIPYHPVPGTDLRGGTREDMEALQDLLKEKGIVTTIRRSRGLDIDAACGLLSTKKLLQVNPEADF
jgi:23S rRNA (adenine2503-C2)-methyltransferase